jgi:hypothetical protein
VILRVIAALSAATLATTGCTAPPGEGCASDSDCKAGLFCQSGNCLCRTDDACGKGSYCNPYGSCQIRPACLGNQDCDSGFICNSADISGGACIPANDCGSNLHCTFDYYCNPNTNKCDLGCKTASDCQLGKVCAGGQCIANGTAADCTICPASPDPDPRYCDPGELCTDQGQCVASQYQSQLCIDCTASNTCGGNLICLIDQETNDTNYCAPSCKLDVDCPAGYSGCGGLYLVFAQCNTAADCTNGGECIGRSESNRGSCACVGSQDCDPYPGICQLSPFGGDGACGLSYCKVGQAGSCSRFGNDVQCQDQKANLCSAIFGSGNCQFRQCARPADCAVYGPGVTCSGGMCTGSSCTSGDQCVCVNHVCAFDGAPCNAAADCQTGVCVKSCAQDSDCMCNGGRCALTDLPCTTAADCAVNCEDGSCVTAAKACGKDSGITCQDLASDTPECRQF